MQLPWWRAFLQDELKQIHQRSRARGPFREEGLPHCLLAYLTAKPFPRPGQAVRRRSEVYSLALRCETMGAPCRYVAHLPALTQPLLTRRSRFQRIFPTPQEALDAGPIDKRLHWRLIRSSLHERQPLLTKTCAP